MQSSCVGMRIRKFIAAITMGVVVSMGLFATSVSADDLKDWRLKVVKKIAKKHIYPRSAISREIEGKARVKVTLARDGAITTFEVVQPSGQAILDKAIPKMMKKLNPLPAPPASLPDENLTFVIPITWRLQ